MSDQSLDRPDMRATLVQQLMHETKRRRSAEQGRDQIDAALNGFGSGDVGRIEAQVHQTLTQGVGLSHPDADEWARIITDIFRAEWKGAHGE